MNGKNESDASVQSSSPAGRTARNPVVAILAGVVVAMVLGVTAYSIYVATHEPDPQETVLLGQTRIAGGSPAAFRIVVRNRVTGRPIAGATVNLELKNQSGRLTKLGDFRTDNFGSLRQSVTIPDLAPGEYQLVIDSKSAVGSDHLEKAVTIQHPVRVLLSSDKPIYQPGQTIHLRSLVLNERTQKPGSGEPVTFEVSDAKGNKVFKEARKTSAFGIAAADFVLADEPNLGRYEIRAGTDAGTGARTVEVKRYVLPKFKVQISADKPYYLPGQKVSGSVRAAYFFGKVVDGGEVKMTVRTMAEQPVTVTGLKGKTDASGRFTFQFALPDFFAGMPQKGKDAFLDLTAEVGDGAGQVETKTLSLSVSQNELEVTVIPEAGQFVPGVENLLYVVTGYPDGRPAACEIKVNGQPGQSDAQGVCVVKLTPGSAKETCVIQVADLAGRKRQLSFVPEERAVAPAFLLRTDRAVYRAGETMRLSVLSPAPDDTVFVDLIKDGQTVVTRSVSLNRHRAELEFALPASLVGTLNVNAYTITDTGEDRGCTRTVYVHPATDLKIAATVAQPVYRPGETARVEFAVTDAEGRPTAAALGIAAVDESVYALAEKRPGLLQQFLDAEADQLKPRYQILSFDSPAWLVQRENQTLAQAYFASLADGQPASLGLDELVKDGYLPVQVIDQIKGMRGTTAYEKLRQDPQYAEVMRAIDGEGGRYDLRDVTGPAKRYAVEAHRKAYFDRLKSTMVVLFVAGLFLLPVVLTIRGTSPAECVLVGAQDTEANRNYVKLFYSTYRLLSLLTLFPFLFYPLGGMIFSHWDFDEAGWALLTTEITVVCGAVAYQYYRLLGIKPALLDDRRPLQFFLNVFLSQFVLSRGGIALAVIYSFFVNGSLVFCLCVGAVLAPLVVLQRCGAHIRGQLRARGLPEQALRSTVLEVLVFIACFFILGAMLLPALSSAKRKAQKISLMNSLKQVDLAKRMAGEDGVKPAGAAEPGQPRVRRDFPETLYWQPELITDDQGRATTEIPLADSITTWRAAIDGVSAAGKLGSAELPIQVFQDFFVDIDAPVLLSLDDEVSVPVTCYNYLDRPQDVRLSLAPAAWFETPSNELSLHLGAGEVGTARFPMRALQVGTQLLRVTARGQKVADAVERSVRVAPAGQRVDVARNEVLKAGMTYGFTVSAQAIPGSQSLVVKFYPSRFSEIVEGLDSIFEEPHGCFEQTSSTTYPNMLALDYLKQMGRLTPEVEVRARKLVNTGYQRLLTFEVPGGGFEWFGRDPAHVGLTAYGLLEFTDMQRVQAVDQAMLERTRNWIYSKQNADGSWNPTRGLDEWGDNSPVTAYVLWALAESGDDSAAVGRGRDYLRTHPEKLSNNYQKALAANAFLARDRGDSFGIKLLDELKRDAVVHKDMLSWPSPGTGLTYSHGYGLEVETTALCTMAMIKADRWPELVKQALTWISKQKNAQGTWGSTQATILAIRALIAGSTASLGQGYDSLVSVSLNGRRVESFHVNRDNSDVMKEIDLTKYLQTGENRIELRQAPAGELPVQVSGDYWLRTGPKVVEAGSGGAGEALGIAVNYDRTMLAVNERLNCSVSVKNRAGARVEMAIVDLGIPPGFDLDTGAFDAMREGGRLEKYEVTGNQVILYLRKLEVSTPLVFQYSLRAKYPLRVQTPASAVYEYYQPTNRAESRPVELRVAGGTW